MRDTMRSLALVLLIVSSVAVSIVPISGTADAQTTTKTITTGPQHAQIDLSGVNQSVTIAVSTEGVPNRDRTTILRQKFDASEYDGAIFTNAGAYQTFTVSVDGADPTIEKVSKLGSLTKTFDSGEYYQLGHTGGDADLNYDFGERLKKTAVPGIKMLDRTPLPDTVTVDTSNLSDADANETAIDLYQSGLNTAASERLYITQLNNTLQDSETVALIKGKNAYIRALNNGESKSSAKVEAQQAIDDYYATKQRNLVSQWNIAVEQVRYISEVAANTTGMGIPDVMGYRGVKPSYAFMLGYDQGPDAPHDLSTFMNPTTEQQFSGYSYDPNRTGNVQLVNGETVQAAEIRILRITFRATGVDWADTFEIMNGTGYGPSHFRLSHEKYGNDSRLADQSKYQHAMQEIESQSQSAKSEIGSFVEGTYSEYEKGQINNSDLVDPYVLSSEFSAGDSHQSWSAAQLSLLGVNSPEKLDQTGYMNISQNGTTSQGILMSQENPASGQFESGKEYNAGNIGGTQYLVTEDGIRELDGQFTLGNITNTNGQRIQNVTIERKQYQTANITELQNLYENLSYDRAQIEARQQALRQAALGGLFGSGQIDPMIALAVIAALGGVIILN